MQDKEFIINQEKMFKLANYFHDGSILDIKYSNNDISIEMESAELSEDDLLINFPECKTNCMSNDYHPRLKGILHLESVTSAIDNNDYTENNYLKMHEQDGEILDIEISKNKLRVFVHWNSFSPQKKTNYYSIINVEFKKAKWINSTSDFVNLRNAFFRKT